MADHYALTKPQPLRLTAPQQKFLGHLRDWPWPGWNASTRQPSLNALLRRGLVTTRPDLTRPGENLWMATPAGRAWIDREYRR